MLRVRTATLGDKGFILDLVHRFVEFGVPRWHDPRDIVSAIERVLDAPIDSSAEDPALMVAQDETGERLGFIRLETRPDHFTGERRGYVSEIAVAKNGEGRGVGKALMEAGEAWARGRGYQLLTLDVFAGNERARSFYRRLGYDEDSLSMAKEL
jgi:ribosomal protein S18 acetylase RimI-like enzyme